jgi:hypothetical protein
MPRPRGHAVVSVDVLEAAMAGRTLHQPRVAWDAARVLVSVASAGDDLFRWFSNRIGELLGEPYRQSLFETRARLGPLPSFDGWSLQAGIWRVRIEDVLRDDPTLAEDLRILTLHATYRLAEDGVARPTR